MELVDYLAADRGRLAEVARRSGVAAAFLWQMADGRRNVPVGRAAQIEAACEGAVRRWNLRPNDWHVVWPELVGAQGAPAPPLDITQQAEAA